MRASRIVVIIVGFAFCVASGAEEIDPYELTIDEIASDDVLQDAEQRFAEIVEIKGLLRNSRSCFHHVTNEELRRLHAMVQLRRDKFLTIESDVRFAVRKAILDIGQDRLWRIRLQKSGSTGGNSFGRLAPVTQVEDFVLHAARKHMGDDRIVSYRQDVRARRNQRQKALVTAITASLDSRLFLSAEQREQVTTLLHSEWHDPWLLCIRQLLIRGVEVMPLLPKHQIEELLTPPQKKLFSNLAWSPSQPPYVGPSDATMAGHEQRDQRLVDELEFVSVKQGGRS